MKPSMEELLNILSRQGIQPSFQRMKILEALLTRRDHPTVLSIYEDVSKEVPTISKTTVYNTLSTFTEKGLVTALTVSSEESRYDVETYPHHHLVCKQCGAILDINICCEYAVKSEVEGHRVEEVHGYFKGICRDCIVSGKAENNT